MMNPPTLPLTSDIIAQFNDLSAARATASFDAGGMSRVLYSDAAQTKRERALKIVESEPVLRKLIEDWPFLGTPDRARRSWPAIKRLAEIKLSNGLTRDDMLYVYNILGFMLPIFNHENSFVAGNLTSHASDEQLKHWLPLAENYRMWGCFAQTELGHGSNISDLETTATYDASTREFILNTPTLSSTKWWIGALGTYATHALVMAKLILNGKDHGLAPFMVPVRDLETHKPLQGVTVGEIGPKLSPIENGFLRLSNVRIPLENLLTRHLNVTPDGQFVKPADSKLLMSGMLVRRTEITASSARALAKACTIGIRYALVRRQNRGVGPGPKKGEAQILTYPMVQMRLLPALAAAYSFQFIGSFLVNLFTNYRSQFLSQDPAFLATLSAFHPTLSSLKSYCTTLALDTIEDIRRTLGGHGYSLASGLGLLHGQWAIFATAEGEAVLMTQQVARWLMKLAREERVEGWRERMRGHVITEYLAELDEPVGKCAVTTSDGFLDRNVQRNVFAHRARRLLRECVEAVDANGGELGLAAPEAYAVSVAHTQNLIQSVFWNTIEELERKGVDGKLVKVLEKLAALNGVYLISKHSSDWLEDGHLDGSQIKLIKTAVAKLNSELVPESANLVDAWDFSDLELQSQLGRSDGRVYEGYFEWALKDPLNGGVGNRVFEGYEEYLRPLLSGEVERRVSGKVGGKL